MSATRTVKNKAAVPDGPPKNRLAKTKYIGHNATARIVAQMRAGRKLAAVHKPRATSTSAKTTLAFMRAPGPRGSGFCSIGRSTGVPAIAACTFFDEAFAVPLMRSRAPSLSLRRRRPERMALQPSRAAPGYSHHAHAADHLPWAKSAFAPPKSYFLLQARRSGRVRSVVVGG